MMFAGAALLALAATSRAEAQQMATPAAMEEDAFDGEAIVVTGSIATAQAASVELKRKADNLIDIVAADSVGRFADQNSAAALSRLPAVAVQRDQGQERYIQVRGAPNRWTSVSIDGVPMIGVDEGGTTRAYRFDAVPAVLLSAMAVNKSLTSNLQAEAIVANIDLRTYSPLAKTGFDLQGDVGYGFMELGDKDQRQASLRASWSDGTFGVVVGGSHYRRKQTTDNREVGAYDAKGPTEFDIRSYQLERENNGLFGAIEYEPVEGQRFFIRSIYTEFKDDEQRNQYEFDLDSSSAIGTRGFASGDLVGVPVVSTFNYGEYRTRNYINTIGGEYESEDGLKASVNLNYTRTENTTYLPLTQLRTSGNASPSIHYDASDPRFPIISLYSTVGTGASRTRGASLTAIDQTTVSSSGIVIPGMQDTFSDSYTVKADFSKALGAATLSGGFLYADRDISGFTFATSNIVSLASGASVGQPFNIGKYVTSKPWDTNFPLGFSFNQIDNVAMRRDVDSLLAALQAAGLYDPAKNVPAANRYRLNEKTLAGYVMGKVEFEGGQVVAGVRVEHFRLDNVGTAVTAAGTVPLSAQQSYTDFFPSINARFDLTPDLVFRIAGQRGIARPSFGEIRVGSSINDTNSPGTISGGNPDLKPEYTWGVDASLEYYLSGGGLASVSAFHRWVDNVLYQNQQAVGSDLYDSNGVDRSGYLLTSTFNGTSGRLYGVEFNYQQQFSFLPSPLDGFGVQGNIALLGGHFDTSTAKKLPFQGLSDTVLNGSFYYEKYGLSARVSYQWRSDWLDTLGGLGSGEYRKGYDNLDVSVRYAVNDNLTLFADATNLTDAIYMAYEDDESKPTEVEQVGRRYMFGIRFAL
ncbi:TonB-dependent receptor (plasmid) [Sphingobium sp. V4]|uniref:TonB-dependent receptor n=1 Tax=Sphingobium sp. V4 TaxID=3038927 RepID=UPI002557D20D|nr:TonB-dependent receptor [Sphingobium sp. V4]WIW90754.1 TonB-dependent receptor [Sphingobium sp. V4]